MANHCKVIAPETAEKLRRFYLDEQRSIPEIATILGAKRSTVRLDLIRCGVTLRTHAESAALSGPKVSARLKGVKRGPFSLAHRRSISRARSAWADKHARGITFRTKGYVSYTRGPNKGRDVHRVTVEKRVGRKLSFNEIVHHRDEDKHNYQPKNLRLMSRSRHTRYHRIHAKSK